MIMMNRAIIYTRSLSKEKEQFTASRIEQLKRCKEFAKEKELTLIECYHDNSPSDMESARPALTEMLQMIATEANVRVIIFSKDRLAMNGLLRANIEYCIELLGAKIIDVSTL